MTSPTLTAYEAQVLIGTSISGCNMQPDTTFELKGAWLRLHKLGLIDRTDGLAIATPKGGALIEAMLSASRTPNTEVAVKALEWVTGDNAIAWVSHSVVGRYAITQYPGMEEPFRLFCPSWMERKPFITLDAAIAAAQADFDQRIRSALTEPERGEAEPLEMTPEEIRLENLKQMSLYSGAIVSFEVRHPYYLASCDKCGWVGSSEQCGTDSFGDDSDVYCPRCHASGADCGKIAEALAFPPSPAQASPFDERDATNLLSVIADIREKSGLGAKPMLSELADAIAARMASPVSAEVTVTDEMLFAAMKRADELDVIFDDIDGREILRAALATLGGGRG